MPPNAQKYNFDARSVAIVPRERQLDKNEKPFFLFLSFMPRGVTRDTCDTRRVFSGALEAEMEFDWDVGCTHRSDAEHPEAAYRRGY